MLYRFRYFARIATLLTLLCLSGCGGGSDDFVFTTGGQSLVPGTVIGKVFLGTDIPGVPVTAETLDGQILARESTDGTGNFIIDASFPSDFRLVARVGPNLVFRREVRGFPNEEFLAITVPTTLVSELASQQPGAPLENLEVQARSLLGLKPGESLGKLDESVNERFSHLAFFAQALQGRGQFSSVQEAVDGSGKTFLLTSEVLEADLSPLGSPLAEILLNLQTDPRMVLSTQRSLSRSLATVPVATTPLASRQVRGQFGEVAAAVGAVALDILENVGENVVESVIDKIFGGGDSGGDGGDGGGGLTDKEKQAALTWLSYQLQAHIGIENDLDAISAELTGIQNEVQQLSQQLQDFVQQLAQQFQLAELVDDIQAANAFQNDIVSRQTSLLQALNDALSQTDYFNNEPSTLPQNITNVLNSLQDSTTQDALIADINGLQALLTGSSSQPGTSVPIEFPPIVANVNSSGDPGAANPNLVLAQRDSIYLSLGISNDSGTQSMANFPVRSSALLDNVLTPFETYGQAQILGIHLLSEAAHQSPSPDSDIKRAKAYADNVARSLHSTRAQVPAYPINEGYLIDLQLGVQWCTTVQSPQIMQRAQKLATLYDDGDTRGWRLATYQEVQALLLRAGWAAGNGTVYTPENAILGLQRLGFNTDSIDGAISCPAWEYLTIYDAWGFDTANTFSLDVTADYRGNADSLRQQVSVVNGFDELPYLLVRTLGDQPTLDVRLPQGNYENPGTWPRGFAGNPIEAELPSVGTFIDYGAANVSNLFVTLQGFYQIFTGDTGGFQIGTTDFPTDYTQRTSSMQSDTVPATYFETNDSAGVIVSNYTGTFGKVIERINSIDASTINFFTLGYDVDNDVYPVVVDGNVNFRSASQVQISMSQLQISPRNVVVDIPGTSGTNTVTQQFLALGFYNGQTFDDLTDEVVWTVVDSDTNGTPVGAVFSTQQPGLLELTNVPNASDNLTITATINQTGNPASVGDDTTAVEAVH